jgi:hypothetical protein
MAIKPKCDMCGDELTAFGGLLFSPPDDSSSVSKYHLCVACFEDIEQSLISNA